MTVYLLHYDYCCKKNERENELQKQKENIRKKDVQIDHIFFDIYKIVEMKYAFEKTTFIYKRKNRDQK